MGRTTSTSKERILSEATFGIAVMRGISALGIGLLLFFYPDKSATILVNTMGLFWLFTGIALLRRSTDDSLVKMVGNRTRSAIAVVGALAGLVVVTRSLTRQVMPEGAYFVLLGAVIMLTGLVQLVANLRAGSAVSGRHRWLSVLLGVFESFLGMTLIISPLDRGAVTYWIATIWALVFGVMVISDAILERSQTHKTAEENQPS